jgi:drug/metabolite transporter (DMT)-like permease
LSAAVALGLLAALGYGVADYLSRFAGRAVGMWRTMLYGELFSLLLLSGWMLLEPATLPAAFTAHANAWYAAIGSALVLMAGTVFLFRGLMVGTLAVVAPVCASYGAITTALSSLTGTRLPERAMAGLAVTILGVCVVSIPPRAPLGAKPESSGIGWALGAALGFGVGFWWQGTYAVPTLGAFVPVWIYYAGGVALLLLLARPVGVPLVVPRGAALALVLATGGLGVVGFIALTLGFGTGEVGIVTVISSLASAVTVLLARVAGKSRISIHQWLALGAIIFGLILIKT